MRQLPRRPPTMARRNSFSRAGNATNAGNEGTTRENPPEAPKEADKEERPIQETEEELTKEATGEGENPKDLDEAGEGLAEEEPDTPDERERETPKEAPDSDLPENEHTRPQKQIDPDEYMARLREELGEDPPRLQEELEAIEEDIYPGFSKWHNEKTR
jgi:hypothetical protein